MKIKIILLNLLLLNCLPGFTQQVKIEPPFWWAGMNNEYLQLMVYGDEVSKYRPMIEYADVRLMETVLVENPNYLFLNLAISPEAEPGSFGIQFILPEGEGFKITYELRERKDGSSGRQGFDASDVVYLLMPDRFSNGNPDNDDVEGMLEKSNRNNPNGRHGGDLQGIRNHLDYLEALGITALWINPLLENNNDAYSYHGYAITDFYRLDPRFGSNEDYLELADDLAQRDMKLIMDMVFNHYGTGHWWTNDLPMADWTNNWPEFTRSNYRGGVVSDPYASESDYSHMVKGWFDTRMADINQMNPFLSTYLIQNSIWWIEYAGLGGIRMDTYPYSYKAFMKDWMEKIHLEYPNFSVVGEVWLPHPPQLAYWQQDAANKDGFNSHLTDLLDFPLMYAISRAFTEAPGWDRGLMRLYETLSLDFLYPNPMKLMTFGDNHDGDRLYNKLGKNLNNYKMAMGFLMTTRGIPQLYYGSEYLDDGLEHDGHGMIRKDFPGGWPGDARNAFTGVGMDAESLEAQAFTRLLLNWRKTSDPIHRGALTHFVPIDNIYVYFRHTDKEAVMVVMNGNDEEKVLDNKRFAEILDKYNSGKDVLQRTYTEDLSKLRLEPRSIRIIELN